MVIIRRSKRLILYSALATMFFLYFPIQYMNARDQDWTWIYAQRDLGRYLGQEGTIIIHPQVSCSKLRPQIAIVVCSSPSNFQARKSIRDTWGSDAKERDWLVLFILGQPDDVTINFMVKEESTLHSDIIQYDYIDTYNNLTIKSLMLLQWITSYCPEATFVMKSDDDIFINVNLLDLKMKKINNKSLLLGEMLSNTEPIRDVTSKWFVPEKVYRDGLYPDYLNGCAYMMSRDVVQLLLNAALQLPFFFLEDVFLTGMCAERAGVSRLGSDLFDSKERCSSSCKLRSVITTHRISPSEMHRVWALVHDKSIRCSSKSWDCHFVSVLNALF